MMEQSFYPIPLMLPFPWKHPVARPDLQGYEIHLSHQGHHRYALSVGPVLSSCHISIVAYAVFSSLPVIFQQKTVNPLDSQFFVNSVI